VISNSQHGFTMCKSWLTTMTGICDKITRFAEDGRGGDAIYLDLSKVLFSTFSPSILISNLG